MSFSVGAIVSLLYALSLSLFIHLNHHTDRVITPERAQHRRLQALSAASKSTTSRLHVLSLGGSVTWGSGLKSREEAYPSLLLKNNNDMIQRSDNLAIRASSAVWPSTCLQSMIRNVAGDDVEYNVIVLDFSLNGLMGLQLLVHRIRRRYPHALLIYVDLYSNRRPGYSNCIEGPKCRTTKHEGLLELMQKVSGVVVSLPRPKDAINYQDDVGQWFAPDHHHLNAAGHEWIAEQVSELIHQHDFTAAASSNNVGSWLEGDLCLSWFHTGDVPTNLLSVSNATLNQFAPEKWAYEVASSASSFEFSTQQLEGPAPLTMVFMTKQDLYPSGIEVSVSHGNGVKLIEPPLQLDVKSTNTKFANDHVTETKTLGTVQPNTDKIQLHISNHDTKKKWPFRLVGLTMCAACKSFDSKFDEKKCHQRACVEFVDDNNNLAVLTYE